MDDNLYLCMICGDDSLDADHVVEHFETMHPFLALFAAQYSHFGDDPRGLAWLN